MATSTNYDELQYLWQQWYDHSGKQMRNDYKFYVPLMNEAAHLNGFSDASKMWQSAYEDTSFVENMNNLWLEIQPIMG